MRVSNWLRSSLSLLVFGLLSAQASAQQRTLCVHGVEAPDTLSVRAGPGANHRIVDRLPAKACGVELVGRCADGWCEMALGQQAGWVNTKNIAVYEMPEVPEVRANSIQPVAPVPPAAKSEPPPPVTAAAPASPRARVVEQGSTEGTACVTGVERGDTLRIRTGPGIDHDEISGIPPGACGVARAGNCRGRWCKVAWRGRVGWVNTTYLD